MVGLYIDSSAHAVGQTFGLFKDFLEHEVRIAALLYLAKVYVYFLHGQLLLLAQNTHHLQILAQTEHSDVSVFQIDHLVGVLNDGTGI